MFFKLVRITLIISIISSCSLLQNKENTILSIDISEDFLTEPIQIRYVNGNINYIITSKSSNSLKVFINGTTNILPEITVENTIFSNNPKRFLIIGSKNNEKYVFLNNKLIGKYKHIDDAFFCRNGNILIVQDKTPSEVKRNNHSNISFSIIQKGNMKYILTSDNQEFGPFLDVETPFQTLDLQNWWIVGKVNHSNYTLIINGTFRLDNLQEIGIPSFYETNFVLAVKISNLYYIVVNGKLIDTPFENIDQPIIFKQKWLTIERGLTNRIIGGDTINQTLKTFYTTTNKILYYLFDKSDNIWSIEETESKQIILRKNFKSIEGTFDELYPYTLDNGEIVFVYRIGNDWFLIRNKKIFGPYESIGDISLVNDKIVFYFTLNNQNYLQIGSQKFGPYEKIENLSIKENTPILVFKDKGMNFILIGNKKLGPYESIFWNTLSYKNGKYLFVFKDDDKMYINYSSKVYGPFKNVYMPILSEDGSMWGAGIMSYENTFSLIFNGKIIGNYINVDYESIRFDSKNGRWGGITQKQNGFYVTTSFAEFGPFERVFQLLFSEDLSKLKFSAKKDNKTYIFFSEKNKIKKILGPFEMAIFVSKNFYNNIAVIKSNQNYFIYNNIVLGPYKYIKEIYEENDKFYFIYGNGKSEVINLNHKNIIETSKIIKHNDILLPSWYVIGIDTSPKVITKTNTTEIFIPKEELMYDKKFFWISKNNEWQSIIVDGKEIGYFNYINPESFIYDYKNNTFGVIARKGKEFYLITPTKIFGPHRNIVKFKIINKDNYLYLVKDTTTGKLYLNGKLLKEEVVDFDIDYKRENIAFITKSKSRVDIKTLKVIDLLHH